MNHSLRILDLTTDSVFRYVDPSRARVTHCQIGKAVMHSGCPKFPAKGLLFRLIYHLAGARKYEWIVLPPIHITWTDGNGFIGRLIKRILRRLMDYPWILGFFRRLIFGRNARILIVDYSDLLSPSEFALRCLEPEHYFMLNVPINLVGKTAGPANTAIHYLPTIIRDPLVDQLLQGRTARTAGHDIFIAGDYHNEQRLKQLDAASILEPRGIKVFNLREKSFEKFTSGLLDSTLCFAGRGIAYHCFRPLEAGAAGAAPIIHTPERGTYHEYVHGENCFIYSHDLSPDGIADFVEETLGKQDEINRVVDGMRKLVNTRHRASVLSSHLLSYLDTDRNR